MIGEIAPQTALFCRQAVTVRPRLTPPEHAFGALEHVWKAEAWSATSANPCPATAAEDAQAVADGKVMGSITPLPSRPSCAQ